MLVGNAKRLPVMLLVRLDARGAMVVGDGNDKGLSRVSRRLRASPVVDDFLRVDVAKTVNADTGVQVWFGLNQPF